MEETESTPLILEPGNLQAPTAAELAQKVFASKARRRRWLAALPVEEKYRHFLKLQRMVAAIKRAAGKPAPIPWPDDGAA
jgi:hypothetical protein